jgi:hypothetical protein
MRGRISRLIMLLILLGSLLAGCGQEMIESKAPAQEAQAGTRAAAHVVSAARIQQLTRSAHNSAVASSGLDTLLRNPQRSAGMISQLARSLATGSVAGTSHGARQPFWERFGRPLSPVIKRSAQRQDGWRTWADEVVERYN